MSLISGKKVKNFFFNICVFFVCVYFKVIIREIIFQQHKTRLDSPESRYNYEKTSGEKDIKDIIVLTAEKGPEVQVKLCEYVRTIMSRAAKKAGKRKKKKQTNKQTNNLTGK